MKIKPKHVLIVGGGSGIGLATAKCILENDVSSVILAGRKKERLIKAREELISSVKRDDIADSIVTKVFDITDVKNHLNFISVLNEEIFATYKEALDGLIISSGTNFNSANWKGFNITESDYDRVMNINLRGPFFLIRNFSNFIIEHKSRANICVVSSISAHRDMIGAYQISKNVLSGIVDAFGKHLVKRGIILNCVEPGTTDTDMMPHLKQYTDGVREGLLWKDNAIRRVIRPEEIAETIAFLISDHSELLAGTCLLAGGGCVSISRGY